MRLFLLIALLTPLPTLASNYDRSEYGGWKDFDSDCQDTRVEELISHALHYQLSNDGCKVVSGKWLDPYTTKYFFSPRDLDVDHIVPLEWAHRHGAEDWASTKKINFANDPENLIPVSASANRSKGSKGFLQWVPKIKDEPSKCAYILHFSYIMSKYGLTFSEKEQPRAEVVIDNCR